MQKLGRKDKRHIQMWENVQSTEGKDCYLKFLEESGSDGGWSDIFRAEVLN